jgi:hypothetical protein
MRQAEKQVAKAKAALEQAQGGVTKKNPSKKQVQIEQDAMRELIESELALTALTEGNNTGGSGGGGGGGESVADRSVAALEFLQGELAEQRVAHVAAMAKVEQDAVDMRARMEAEHMVQLAAAEDKAAVSALADRSVHALEKQLASLQVTHAAEIAKLEQEALDMGAQIAEEVEGEEEAAEALADRSVAALEKQLAAQTLVHAAEIARLEQEALDMAAQMAEEMEQIQVRRLGGWGRAGCPVHRCCVRCCVYTC